MPVVELSHITKSFGDHTVVRDISLLVDPGEVFGLIGPNGAGKTTMIRIMLDLIKPDSGEVRVLGEAPGEATKNHIGYLPEERGLYRDMTVIDSLTYLATLKGMDSRQATARAEELLRRIDMLDSRKKKTKELSRGMGQFVQFLVTIMHESQLIVLDEPFANLDPVNTEMIKQLILELRSQGRAIILSTHRMNEVEELCDRIMMIHEGRSVLYGELDEIKSRYRTNSVLLDCGGEIGEIEGVIRQTGHENGVELFLDGKTTPQKVLEQLVARGVTINRFEVATPPLHDIFLRVVGDGQ